MSIPNARTRSALNKIRRAELYRNLTVRVADALKLDRSHVYRIMRGQRRSRRVEARLILEVERIENLELGS